ncbi:MAG: Si-specific NAD(P)(+) transhydrogenase [Polyangia bacterium]
MYDYDLVVIGSGPAGEKAATQAAYFGKRVAVVERDSHLGGACINTGTLPSKTLRETALYLSGLQQRTLYGVLLEVRHNVSVRDLMCRQEPVIGGQNDLIRWNLDRHRIELLRGAGAFIDEHTIEITTHSGTVDRVTTDAVLIATGTSPFRPSFVPWGDPEVDDSDTILKLPEVPKRLVILGGGVIGCEYGSMFAALGCEVTIVEARDSILGFLDVEVNKLLSEQLRAIGIDLQLRRKVVEVARKDGALHCVLDDGHDLECERLLFAGGRAGNTTALGLDKIGVAADARGLLKVDEHYALVGPSGGRIYAAGDVIGFPALASVAMEQGRVAACHAFDLSYKRSVAKMFPYGLYTIPEVSMVGETEESATQKGLSFEVGRARYGDNARGQIIGDTTGMVKLLFTIPDRKIIGVHVLGERATEIIHTGMAVMHFGGTLDDFIDMVFNFPTLGELYKYAAYDGLGRLAHRSAFDAAPAP